MNSQRFRKLLDAILVPILAILSGLVVMGVLILFLKKPLFESYVILFANGFGCREYGNCIFITALERATPIILTGLSAVVAFRSGMFSIGQEVEYLVQFPMRADQSAVAHSPVIDKSAQLISFLPGSKWGMGFVIAVIAVIAVYYYLWHTKPGYEQR